MPACQVARLGLWVDRPVILSISLIDHTDIALGGCSQPGPGPVTGVAQMAGTITWRTVDLRDTRCPANCVEIIAALEAEPEGQVMEFWIAADTVLDIPRMLRESGHDVRAVETPDDATLSIIVARRPEAVS
jgi:TusA-related sulfurtransferase